jgi:hypothetical protein
MGSARGEGTRLAPSADFVLVVKERTLVVQAIPGFFKCLPFILILIFWVVIKAGNRHDADFCVGKMLIFLSAKKGTCGACVQI